MNKHQLRIDILGTSFTIQSDERPEYLRALYDYFKKKVSDAKFGSDVNDPLKISILACLNCIDELFKEREKAYRLKNGNPALTGDSPGGEPDDQIDEVAARIMKKIDESLGGK
jgi:cell division protein ZapA (FtsZ GTPase activity inhibitor)